MALMDYIHCEVCAKKLIYDGDGKIRGALEKAFGVPSVKALCAEHGGGIVRIGPDAERHTKER